VRYVLYPLFGLLVIGGYAMSAMTASDLSSTPTTRTTLPPGVAGGMGVSNAPIVWRTGFHGPAAYEVVSSGSSGSGSGVGYYGGYGGGK
jgi:hypothetical protein